MSIHATNHGASFVINVHSNETAPAGRALRIKTFCRLYEISEPTVWRYVSQGKIAVTYVGSIPYVSHSEQIRLGLIAA